MVQLFGVSLATIKRYLKQRREEGHVQPKAIPGRPPRKRAHVEAGVLSQLQASDDATLEQHCDFWEQAHGERVSRWTMSRAIKRLGWTRKKSLCGRANRMKLLELLGGSKRASYLRKTWSWLTKPAHKLI